MDKFIIEVFSEGEFLSDEIVEADQRLLNERDLDCICVNKDKDFVFVRRAVDTNMGYFLDYDYRWDYGTREDALRTIKMRL